MKKITQIHRLKLKLISCSILLFSYLCLFSQIKEVSKVSEDLLAETKKVQTKSLLLPSNKPVKPKGLFKTDQLIRNSDGMILIDALSRGNAAALESDLVQLGVQNASSYGSKVSGFIPTSAINKLSELNNLVYAAPVYKPHLNSGPAYTNGDIALKSNLIRSELGLDGTGIKIGVLSDSYNALQGAEQGVLDGELPGSANPNGYSSEVQILSDIEEASDEGRGMCEIIHDIAPASEMAFHTAFTGEVEFANGIVRLAEAGCGVITDDVSYFNEPFFQDGIIAQAVDFVVDEHNVSYYSSAGNSDRDSYESEFRKGSIQLASNPYDEIIFGEYVFHDFDPSTQIDIFQEVTLLPNSDLILAFQWDEPFASVCEGCPGSASDLDIFLCLSENTDDVVLQSINSNINGDPWEILGASYGGEDTLKAYVCFGKWTGAPGDNPDPNLVKYIQYGDVPINEYLTGAPTTMGHSNSSKGVGVGASFYFRTPEFGFDPPEINYYSSAGSIPILFNTRGKRLKKAIYRKSPLFTATDGGNTSFFGFLYDDGDDFPNFFGTSASAPHAAAVTAQLKQMADERVSGDEINKILCRTAIDMDDPATPGFDKGYDRKSGYGLIQADIAAEELLKKVGITTLVPYAECSDNPEINRNWRVNNPNPFAVEVNWEIIGTNQQGSFLATPGDNYLETNTREYYNLLTITHTGPWGSPRKYVAYSPGNNCNGNKSAIALETQEIGNIPPTLLLSTYPNPFTDNINLDFYSLNEGSTTIQIYNVQGKLVYNSFRALGGNVSTFNLDLSTLENGFYILNVKDENSTIIKTAKLLKY